MELGSLRLSSHGPVRNQYFTRCSRHCVKSLTIDCAGNRYPMFSQLTVITVVHRTGSTKAIVPRVGRNRYDRGRNRKDKFANFSAQFIVGIICALRKISISHRPVGRQELNVFIRIAEFPK